MIAFMAVDVPLTEGCLLGKKRTTMRGHSFPCSRTSAENTMATAYQLQYSLSGVEELDLLVRGSKMSAQQILTRPGWSNVSAIKNNRIYHVDDRIEFPSPVVFDALEELAGQIHP